MRTRPDSRSQREPDDTDRDRGNGSQRKTRWPLIILAVVVLLAVIAGVVYWLLTRNLESTDDAYTEGNAIAYASKVSGYVTQLNVDDNSFVHAGDLLLKIDPRDYTTARDQARASLSLAKAQLSSGTKWPHLVQRAQPQRPRQAWRVRSAAIGAVRTAQDAAVVHAEQAQHGVERLQRQLRVSKAVRHEPGQRRQRALRGHHSRSIRAHPPLIPLQKPHAP